MTPVHQTRSGPQGNCFEACVASLLDVTIEDVPPITSWPQLKAYLAENGRRLEFHPGDGRTLESQRFPGTAIAGVALADGAIHSILFSDGKMVHDPAPRSLVTPNCPVLLWTLIR